MTTIRDQVLEFHQAMGQPILPEPGIPYDARVRLRARLITEEFLETISAMFDVGEGRPLNPELRVLKKVAARLIESATVRVDLVELADGLADLDYVVEGTRLEFGIDGGPIAAEVHRSNMAKAGGPVSPEGKRLKPPGWTPPDIAGCLESQRGGAR